MPLISTIKRNVKLAILGLPTPILKRIVVMRWIASHPGEIKRTIVEFSVDAASDNSELARTEKKIKTEMHKHLITPDEYYLYEFADKTEAEKKEFVGDIERTVLCSRMYNTNPAGLIFMDKMATFRHFSEFFKREVIEIASKDDYESYCSFVDRHETYMVKPSGSSRGNGIIKEVVGSESEDRLCAFRRILDKGPCVIEEVIDQGEEMAKLHPQSVNTIRYATFYDAGSVNTICCFVKIGRGLSVVDNGGAGGFLAAVDEETGRIITPGRTEFGEDVDIHPDTGIRIIGYQIPAWGDLKSMILDLVKILPEQKYVGWDLAWSATKGWVLVEGNSGGQFVGPQISLKKGIGPIIESTFGRLQ